MSAAEGLESYGWWRDYRAGLRDTMRGWVRGVLVPARQMTDAQADRFIASLGPAKVDDLARRALLGLPAHDF